MYEFEITWPLDDDWREIDNKVFEIVGEDHWNSSGAGFGQRDVQAGGYSSPQEAERVRVEVLKVANLKCSNVYAEEMSLD